MLRCALTDMVVMLAGGARHHRAGDQDRPGGLDAAAWGARPSGKPPPLVQLYTADLKLGGSAAFYSVSYFFLWGMSHRALTFSAFSWQY